MRPFRWTPLRRRFVEEFVVDLDGKHAAIRAGFAMRGAHVEGSRLLKVPEVQEAIVALKAERSKRTGINADWLLRRLADEAEADLGDLYGDDGALKPIKDWPPIWRKGLVAGVDVEEIRSGGAAVGIIRKVKLADRGKRLELIGRHIDVQAFRDRMDIVADVAFTDTRTREQILADRAAVKDEC